MLISLYYLSYISQLLFSDLVYLTLLVSVFILYNQIIKKKDDLFKIFLVILPTLSPINFNGIRFDGSIFFFMNIDPIFIACLFYFYRNCVHVNYRNISLIFLIYVILFIYSVFHVLYMYFDGQVHNQGLTYAFKAIFYINVIFNVYNNDLTNFKKQIIKIITLSLIVIVVREILIQFDSLIITGHLIFLAAAFPALIVFYRLNIFNISLYLASLFVFLTQSITVISIFIISNLFIFLRKFRIIFNKTNVLILINFQIIFLISIFYLDIIIKNYDPDNLFYTKFLYDRLPIFLTTLDNFQYFEFQSKVLYIQYDNIVTTDTEWASGSHNYFLTMTQKLGIVPASALLLLINLFFIKVFDKIKSNYYSKEEIFRLLFIALLISFAVFSSAGNAYAENTGFLFFLLVGSLNSSIKLKKMILLINNH